MIFAADGTLPLTAVSRLQPPDRLTVAQWADRHRVLDPIYSPGEPGSYSSARTPYLIGIWDAWADPTVRQITFVKPTQIGGTEALMNAVGFTIAEDPGPIMIVCPTGDDAREFKDRVSAMIDSSVQLRQFAPRDKADDLRTQVRYGATLVYYRGSESPRALSRVAVRKVVIDEADKTPLATAGGREAGAIQLARHRLRTVNTSKLYVNSTPSTRDGPIWREWEKSDQRRYHVPCPHCGGYQVMEFANIRWPDGATADDLERDQDALYHCIECGQGWDVGRDKAAALAKGVWVPKGGAVQRDGAVEGRTTRHAGFHLSALVSPWLSWSDIAAEHLRARTIEMRRDFTNGYLGWIFEEQVERIDAERLEAKAGGYAQGTIPLGVQIITVGVDCKKKEAHYEVRGWGTAGQTWLIEAGLIGGAELAVALEELGHRVLQREWLRVDGKNLGIRRVFIDSGYKPFTVSRFCRKHPGVKAVAGRDENPGRNIIRAGTVEKTIGGRVMGRPVLLIDTNEVKDVVSETMASERWHTPDDIPKEWFRHMAAEHAVVQRKGGRSFKRWIPLPGGGQNHWFDCCVYNYAAAYSLGAWSLPEERPVEVEAPRASPLPEEIRPSQRMTPPSERERHRKPRGFLGGGRMRIRMR